MITQFTPQERRDLGQKLGIHEQYLYQCLTGRRDMNPVEANRVERDSAGVLKRQMLCQKTWKGIWPELPSLESESAAKQAAPLACEIAQGAA